MNKGLGYSITVNVPDGMSIDEFRSKLDKFFAEQDKLSTVPEFTGANQFWVTERDELVFVNNKGQIIATMPSVFEDDVIWNKNKPVSNDRLLRIMTYEERDGFVQTLGKNFLMINGRLSSDDFSIKSTLEQGMYLIDKSGRWCIFDKREGPYPHALCYYNPKSKVILFGCIPPCPLSSCRKMTDEEKEAFDKVLEQKGRKLIKEDGVYKIVFYRESFHLGDFVWLGNKVWGIFAGYSDGYIMLGATYYPEMDSIEGASSCFPDGGGAYRLMTDKEKHLFLFKLKEKGKRLDFTRPILNILVDVRAKKGDIFWKICNDFDGSWDALRCIERCDDRCDRLFNAGNYFLSDTEAWEAIGKVKELMLNLREDKE